MHSGELARLAGVTVRTLRHYHQVGVVAEPERRSNGYREYDVRDLIRVLRIRRLASLGIPLDQMPELLDGPSADAGELLDTLDAELAAQIDHLTAQRELIARLRAHDSSPDLPPELAPFLAVFAASGQSPALVQLDREQSVLLAHLAGEEGMPQLTRFYERLSDPAFIPAVAAISQAFESLGPGSSAQEVEELIERFTATFAPVLADFAESEATLDLSGAAELISEYYADLLNEQQRYAVEELERRLSETGEP